MTDKTSGKTDGESSGESKPTVTVDPADVITALRFNEEEMGYPRSRTARLEVRDGEARLHYHERGNYYPAGHGPDYAINVRAFVTEDGREDGVRLDGTSYPLYSETRALVKREQGAESWDDVDEDVVDEWHAEAAEVWEQDVRAALRDEVTVWVATTAEGDEWETLTVEYREGEGEGADDE